MAEPSFHGQITVEFQDVPATEPGIVAIEFSVGERGRERVVLIISKPGAYQFPEVVKADVPISIRLTPGIDMQLRIQWGDTK
jgi:hypothetical protein